MTSRTGRTSPNKLLTTEAIAAMFCVTPGTVRRWIAAGLPASKPGGKYWRVKHGDAVAWGQKMYGASS